MQLGDSLLLLLSIPVGLAPLTSAALPAADVIVVDASGAAGADFSSIQAAVDVAANGDTILIRDGDYAEDVLIEGMAVDLFAEAGASVSLDSLLIKDVPSIGRMIVRGLTIDDDAAVFFSTSLRLNDCLGPVWLEDVAVITSQTSALSAGGIRVHDSPSVVLTNVLSEPPLGFGLTPLIAVNSDVAVYDSTLLGLNGLTSVFGTANSGGNGISVFDSNVYASGCTITGGSGGDATNGGPGGDGGPGVIFFGEEPVLRAVGTTIAGGAPGSGNPDGVQGPLIEDQSTASTFEDLAHPSYGLRSLSPVREGETATLTLEGQPSAPYWMFLGQAELAGFTSPLFDGTLHVSFPLLSLATGTLDGAGAATHSFSISELGAGTESRIGFAQAVFLDSASGRFTLSGPTATLLLDASF